MLDASEKDIEDLMVLGKDNVFVRTKTRRRQSSEETQDFSSIFLIYIYIMVLLSWKGRWLIEGGGGGAFYLK